MNQSVSLMTQRFGILLMLWLLCVQGSGVAFAQGADFEKAHQLFEARAYHEAISAYQEILAKASKKGKEEKWKVDLTLSRLQLAESYRLTGNYPAASTWYGAALQHAVSGDSIPSYFYLQHARMLQIQDQCEEARSWFATYMDMEPGDQRGAAGLASCDQVSKLEKASFDVVNLALNSTENDFGVSFRENRLWFCSGRNSGDQIDPWTGQGFLDLFESEDWQSEEPIATPLPTPLNSPYHDGPGVYVKQGHQTVFTRTMVESKGRGLDRKQQFSLGIYLSESDGESWSAPSPLDLQLPGSLVMHPTLSSDGEELIFASDAPGGYGGFDLYRCEKRFDGSWSSPALLSKEINTPGDELYPYVDDYGNLWYASDGLAGFGGLDLYIAHRKKKDEGWLAPSLLAAPLNSNYDDFGLVWLKTDTLGVMASNRPGGMGGDDLYEVSRNWRSYLSEDLMLTLDSLPLLNQERDLINILGQTVRTTTGESTGGGIARVILPPNNDTVLVMNVDEDGFFGGSIPSGESYLLEVEKTNYLSDPVVLDTRNMKTGDQVSVLAEVSEMRKDLVVEMNNIYYDYGKFNIREDAEHDLLRLLKVMQNYPDLTIELSSHTDSRSSAAYNQKLSQQRAESARNFLVERGIEARRIEAVGYGETRLRNHCTDEMACPEEEHQFNRRTEFRITYFDAVVDSRPREFAPGSVPTPEEIVAARQALQSQQQHHTDWAVGGELAVNPWSSGTWQGVQIGIDRNHSSDRFDGFAWLGNIQVEPTSQGFFRYVIGYFPTRAEAEQILEVIQDAGIHDAFIPTYIDGQRTR